MSRPIQEAVARPSIRERAGKSRVVRGLLGLTAMAAGVGVVSGLNASAAPSRHHTYAGATKPERHYSKLQLREAVAAYLLFEQSEQTKLTNLAIQAAKSVLADMDKPTAGTTSAPLSQGTYYIGNKAAIVNPNSTLSNPLPNNPGYEYVPEMRATYTPSLGLIAVLAYAGVTVKNGPNAGQEEFTSVDMAFSISPNSTFARDLNGESLVTSDFDLALSDPSLRLDSINMTFNGGFNNTTKQAFGNFSNNNVTFYNYGAYTTNSTSSDIYFSSGGVKSAVENESEVASEAAFEDLTQDISSLVPVVASQLDAYSNNQLPGNA